MKMQVGCEFGQGGSMSRRITWDQMTAWRRSEGSSGSMVTWSKVGGDIPDGIVADGGTLR